VRLGQAMEVLGQVGEKLPLVRVPTIDVAVPVRERPAWAALLRAAVRACVDEVRSSTPLVDHGGPGPS
jgi:hypothetical protein